MAEPQSFDALTLLTTASRCSSQEYPHTLDQVLQSDADLLSPRTLHPAFYGAYDWHSAVHNHWLLAYGLRRWPAAAAAAGAEAVLNRHLTEENLGTELAFFQRAEHAAVERPYGWAWFILLAGELQQGSDSPDRRRWRSAVRPMAEHFMDRSVDYLDGLERPIVSGSYNDTAFAMNLMIQGGQQLGEQEFVARLTARAVGWFGDYRVPPDVAAVYGDFLPRGLTVADLMATLSEPGEFDDWLGRSWPELGAGTTVPAETEHLATDPDGVHQYGLFLSRAWSLYSVADAIGPRSRRHGALTELAAQQARIGLKATATGDFLSDHWIPTFLAYLDARRASGFRG